MTGGQDQRPEVEAAPDQPRIYLASLSDYNDGRLHGAWIDANQSAEELAEAAASMLAASPMAGAEEHAIFDHDGFGSLHLSEYESLANVARLARGIAEHGPAFAAWAELLDPSEWDELDHFEEHFRGHWESVEAYAQDLLDDTGFDLEDGVAEWLRPYVTFDLAAFARDLATDISAVASPDSGVWIFDANY